MKFSDLLLEPSLQSSIDKLGYQDSTPIQAATMPLVVEGKDIAGLAQTGTGKTAAFLIPMMDRILKGRVQLDALNDEQKAFVQKRSFQDWKAQNFILILVPTRELAEQVYENIGKLGEASGLRGIAVYGGTGYDKQKEAFKNQVEFVVATPGRLIDLYKEHFVDLKQVRAIVFDEADRMFDMGFKDDMKFILSRVPRERQFLVFSATLNFDVLNTAYQFGAEPIEIDVSRDQARAENVKDNIFHVGHDEKPMYLLSALKKHSPKQAIIFSNFKANVDKIARFLSENGVPAAGISSLLTQAQRNRVLEQFKAENEKNILVATDVAARGLDIKGVDMVINYELPMDAESYVHRIGRTGRAGSEGVAVSLVSDRDVDSLSRIEDYLKHKLEIGWMEDTEFVREFKAFPRDDYGHGREDRGPRREGGHSGGGRPDNRGPRREGGHSGGGRPDNRGPRREGGHSGGGRPDNRGPRREGQGGHPKHGDRPDNRGPRREGQGAHPGGGHSGGGRPDNRGPRREGQGGHPKHGDRPDNRGPKRDGPHQKHSENRPHAKQGDRPKHGNKSHGAHRKPHGASKPPAGIVGKVSGFFKKLFGE